jgi:hypothetical protein
MIHVTDDLKAMFAKATTEDEEREAASVHIIVRPETPRPSNDKDTESSKDVAS